MDGSVTDASSALREADGLQERRLGRIAELLGCPVEALMDGAASDGDVANTGELLRLWLAIGDAEGRQKVLTLARKLAQT